MTKDLFGTRYNLTVEKIKKLALEKNDDILDKLIQMYEEDLPLEIKREIVSSIGRQKNNDKIYNFLQNNAFKQQYMEIIHQMYRTTLYKSHEERFYELGEKINNFYDNEVMHKMKNFFIFKRDKKSIQKAKKKIDRPILLCGDNKVTLKHLDNYQINMIFTSPPYYNARTYSDYKSYKEYLMSMYDTFLECNRVLEDGRFILVNVSPVISKRAGREFESIRYPIHFDFHKILEKAGFYFIDEIIWIKPEYSVINRIAGYLQTKMPLSYKPNCITESILVYRKNADFLLDKNIKKYDRSLANEDEIDTTNCWTISPKSSKKHPAIFPEELCEKVLKYYSFKGDVVLDPFAGSGTLGRVAKKMGRIPVLCEINSAYIDLISKEDYDVTR